MVSFTQLAIVSLAALLSNAAPTRRHHSSCLSAEQAQTVATKYGELISAYSDAAADAILTPNFTDYSEGVNTLINTCPQGEAAKPIGLLEPTFTTRDLFKEGQGQQPLINFKQLALWYNCNSVTIRWTSDNTAPGLNVKPVIGLIVMTTVEAPTGSVNPFIIDTVYSEFDSGAWLQNLAAAGICGSTASVIGAPAPASAPQSSTAPVASVVGAPAPASAPQSSAAPVAVPTASSHVSIPASTEAVVPVTGTKIYEKPTASHFKA